jgi:hypothetical protein
VCSCFQLNLLCVKSAHVCVLDFAAYSFRSLPLVYFTADFPLDFGPHSPRAGVSSPALSSWLRLQFWFREGSSAWDGLWPTSSLKIALESGLDLCHRSLTLFFQCHQSLALFFRFLIPAVFAVALSGPRLQAASQALLLSFVRLLDSLCCLLCRIVVNYCREKLVYLLSQRIKRLEVSWFKLYSHGGFLNTFNRCSVKCL